MTLEFPLISGNGLENEGFLTVKFLLVMIVFTPSGFFIFGFFKVSKVTSTLMELSYELHAEEVDSLIMLRLLPELISSKLSSSVLISIPASLTILGVFAKTGC